MIDRGKKNILGVSVDAVDYAAAVSRIIQAAHTRENMVATALAVHGIMTGVFDREHRYRLNDLDLVVPDGQPVRWALNLLHHLQLPDRVYGPTLMLRTCERASAEGLPIYLYGSTPSTINALAENLQSRLPNLAVAGMQPSHFRRLSVEEKLQVADEIEESGATIVFVGLGCPRQEVWVYEYREVLSMPLVAVGAAFDFHAGKLPQAPKALQDAGLEWLFRLMCEPKRLWRRYLILNPVYVMLTILQISRLQDFDVSDTTPPSSEMRYG